MAIRGQKPTSIEKRMKALLFGKPGAGKTTAAIQFPKPYLIDTERGAVNDEYVEMLERAGGMYYFTTAYDDVVGAVTELLTEKHEFRTLIIDPLSVIYHDMLDSSAEKNGTDFGKHKQEPDRKIKRLLNLLLRLDMNVIITSHAKDNWVRSKDAKGKDIATTDGITFDCYPKLDYLFDLVFEIQLRGKDRVAIPRKTRLKSFPQDEAFKFSYDAIAERYGRDVLERNANSETLATVEQVAELDRLAKLINLPDEKREKWLAADQAETWSELPEHRAAACIAHMRGQIDGKAA